MDLVRLQSILNTLWVVWFFLLFTGILWWILRPSRKHNYEGMAEIPLRDELSPPSHPSRS